MERLSQDFGMTYLTVSLFITQGVGIYMMVRWFVQAKFEEPKLSLKNLGAALIMLGCAVISATSVRFTLDAGVSVFRTVWGG